MRFRPLLVLAFMLCAMQSASAQYAAVNAPRKIMSWVAPYAIAASKARLQDAYGSNIGPRNSLTHLALQFWIPKVSPAGVLTLARSAQGATTNANIGWFVNWGHSNGIKVMLCVFNAEHEWDWTLAQAVIKASNRTKFIDALIAQMQALKLDGIDIDLEGPNNEHPADKAAFVAFIKELGQRVHLLNKMLTVDSFPIKWNAPNWTWWEALFPNVDAINSMGYEELGINAAGSLRYVAQAGHAGAYAAKLNIGIPSYLPSWLGNTTLEQIQWFRTAQAGRVGIAIWDAQFPDASWKSLPVWNNLSYIRRH